MKGTPETPQCGFSRASIQILGLQGLDPEKFSAFNVLEDDALRAGMSCLSFSLLVLSYGPVEGCGEVMGKRTRDRRRVKANVSQVSRNTQTGQRYHNSTSRKNLWAAAIS